jgi:serine/threonine protein kinase
MNDAKSCPKCQAELPADSPQGLCPKCLVQAGFESTSEPGPAADVVDPAARPTVQSPQAAKSAFVPPTPDQLATLFPQLEILELLGRGGMGMVYKARQTGLNRLVAVKILPPEVGQDSEFAERFTREARALARLNHPHIVTIHDFGQAGQHFYFVMEFVDGANLRYLIQEQQIAPAQALAIVPQICDALQYAHDEGIVHRDIKPENILLDKKGRVKIADFGLSKLLNHDQPEVSLTGTHQVMGTLRYMAPEQLQGTKAVDHRADIYSLGVVFYELLTGQIPMGRFEPPSRKIQVDVRLDEVVLRALAQEPEKRYQQAHDVKTDVEAVRSKSPRVLAPSSDLNAAEEEVLVKALRQDTIRAIRLHREMKGSDLGEATRAVEQLAASHGIPLKTLSPRERLWQISIASLVMAMAAAFLGVEARSDVLKVSLFVLGVILYLGYLVTMFIGARKGMAARKPEAVKSAGDSVQPKKRQLQEGILSLMRPQSPAYVRTVAVPLLVLTALCMVAGIVVSLVVPQEIEWAHMLAVVGNWVLVFGAATILHVWWVMKGRHQPSSASAEPQFFGWTVATLLAFVLYSAFPIVHLSNRMHRVTADQPRSVPESDPGVKKSAEPAVESQAAGEPIDFNGTWDSNRGLVTLTHLARHEPGPWELTGTYYSGRAWITGTIDPRTRMMVGTFREANDMRGRVELVISDDNENITGHYGFVQPGLQDDEITKYRWDMKRRTPRAMTAADSSGTGSARVQNNLPTAAELAHILEELPDQFTQSLLSAPAESIRQLDTQVWALDFDGGPAEFWMEVKETGQQSFPTRFPSQNPTDTWRIATPKARVLLWIQPRESVNMDRTLAFTGRSLPGCSIGIDVNGERVFRKDYNVPERPVGQGVPHPLWFGWASTPLFTGDAGFEAYWKSNSLLYIGKKSTPAVEPARTVQLCLMSRRVETSNGQ